MSEAEPLDDPLAALSLPSDRRIVTLRALAQSVLSLRGVQHVVDAQGAAPALAAHALPSLEGADFLVEAPDLTPMPGSPMPC